MKNVYDNRIDEIFKPDSNVLNYSRIPELNLEDQSLDSILDCLEKGNLDSFFSNGRKLLKFMKTIKSRISETSNKSKYYSWLQDACNSRAEDIFMTTKEKFKEHFYNETFAEYLVFLENNPSYCAGADPLTKANRAIFNLKYLSVIFGGQFSQLIDKDARESDVAAAGHASEHMAGVHR